MSLQAGQRQIGASEFAGKAGGLANGGDLQSKKAWVHWVLRTRAGFIVKTGSRTMSHWDYHELGNRAPLGIVSHPCLSS